MKSRITRITVSRLYNLGNYENCSYSITVDVAEGESAARCVRGLEHILQGLKPLRDVLSPQEAARKRESIEQMKKLTDEDFRARYGEPTGGRRAYTQRCLIDLKKEVEASLHKVERAKKARDLFDDLGGAEKWKDAKLDWEDNQW